MSNKKSRPFFSNPTSSSSNIKKVNLDLTAKPLSLSKIIENQKGSTCPALTNEKDIAVTFITHSSPDRIWLLAEDCSRWPADIIAVVYNRENVELQEYLPINWKKNCPKLTILDVQPQNKDDERSYPVNRLRNLGIKALKTSHYIMVGKLSIKLEINYCLFIVLMCLNLFILTCPQLNI